MPNRNLIDIAAINLISPSSTDYMYGVHNPTTSPEDAAFLVGDLGAIEPFSLILSHSDIINSPTTGSFVLKTAASNEFLKVLSLSASLSPYAADYTNVDAGASLRVALNLAAGWSLDLGATRLLTPGAAKLHDFFSDAVANGFLAPAVSNTLGSFLGKSLTFEVDNNGAGNFTGGNSSQYLVIDGIIHRMTIPT